MLNFLDHHISGWSQPSPLQGNPLPNSGEAWGDQRDKWGAGSACGACGEAPWWNNVCFFCFTDFEWFFTWDILWLNHGIYYFEWYILNYVTNILHVFLTGFMIMYSFHYMGIFWNKRWIILPLQVPLKIHTPRGPKTFCNWTPRGHVASWTSGWHCVRCIQCRG